MLPSLPHGFSRGTYKTTYHAFAALTGGFSQQSRYVYHKPQRNIWLSHGDRKTRLLSRALVLQPATNSVAVGGWSAIYCLAM
jgi:hypothetical protein